MRKVCCSIPTLLLIVLVLPGVAAGALHVAVIRLDVRGDIESKAANLVSRVGAAIAAGNGSIDVLVTPEYSLTSTTSSGYHEYALDLSCDPTYDHCMMASSGGQYSDNVLATVEQLRTIAAQHGIMLFLGTVIERFDASANPDISDDYVYFNDLLILHPGGEVSLRRKTSDDWQASCCLTAIRDVALTTVRDVTITDKEGDSFRTLPIICGERFYPPLINYALSNGLVSLDLLIGPEREGDTPYQAITEAIQNGTWSESLFGWDWGIASGYIATYVDSGILRDGAYFVVAEGASGTGGLINLSAPPSPVAGYLLHDFFMLGAIPAPVTSSEVLTWSAVKSMFRSY